MTRAQSTKDACAAKDTAREGKDKPGTERIYSRALRLAKMDLEHILKALRKQTIQL